MNHLHRTCCCRIRQHAAASLSLELNPSPPASNTQHTEEKIKELISALDMRKDEAIERTFKVGTQRSLPLLAVAGA